MISKHRIIISSFTFLFAILFITFFALSGNAQTLYSCESPNGSPLLHTIDPNTGATLTTTPISLPGEELRGCNGLARDPSTGTCWIVLSPPGSGGSGTGGNAQRLLATIDQDTGNATLIGNTGERIAGIAFNTSGSTLYGLTGNGDGAFIPNIVTLSKLNGSPTLFKALGEAEFGEALGFNPLDGLLYRATGFNDLNGLQNFSSINPSDKVATLIPLSGDTAQYGEQLALTHLSNNLLLSSQRLPLALHTISTSGIVSFVGDMDHEAKGLAFDCGTPPSTVPTLSEWGLIAMAGILGIVGFIVMIIRRRKVTA